MGTLFFGEPLEEYWRKTGEKLKFVRRIENGTGKNGGVQYWIPPSNTTLRSSNWTDVEVSQIKKDYDLPFENPKSVNLLMELMRLIDSNNFTVLDFFAGSATTADAVLRLNSQDGGSRRFIMVQLDELINKDSGSLEAGFKTISEVSRERIRRAGKKMGGGGFSSRLEPRCRLQGTQGRHIKHGGCLLSSR